MKNISSKLFYGVNRIIHKVVFWLGVIKPTQSTLVVEPLQTASTKGREEEFHRLGEVPASAADGKIARIGHFDRHTKISKNAPAKGVATAVVV